MVLLGLAAGILGNIIQEKSFVIVGFFFMILGSCIEE
jgi:hypothetical protein